jgi:glycosyltransferase involved in cell wall biosynthesis
MGHKQNYLQRRSEGAQKKIYFKILYDGRYPSEKAAALFVSEQAHHLLKSGYEAEIITSTRKTSQENPKYADEKFSVSEHTTIGPPFSPSNKVILVLNQLRFGIKSRRYISKMMDKKIRICVICNTIFPLIVQNKKNFLVFEIHDAIPKWLEFKFFSSRVSLLICTNSFKFKELSTSNQKKSLILRNPTSVTYNLDLEDTATSKKSLISFFNAPHDSKIVLYTGSFGPEKNPRLLFEIVTLLPGFSFCFLGPKIEETMKECGIQEKPANFFFRDSVDVLTVKKLQKGADVLLLTENQENSISALYTSPMKLIEYIDARRTIVAPDLPAIREFLPLSGLYLYKSDSIYDLKKTIMEVVSTEKQIVRSDEEMKKYSWEFRISNIVSKYHSV